MESQKFSVKCFLQHRLQGNNSIATPL